MRTILSMPEAKRNKTVDETVEYFISLCSVLGLYEVKREFMELSYQIKSPCKSAVFGNDCDNSLVNPFSFSSSSLTK